MSPSRILYVITKAEIGGAQANVLDLIRGFHNRYEVHLAVGSEGPLTVAAAALGIPVHLLPSMRRPIELRADLRAVRECLALIRRIKPDLIHAHSSKAGLVVRSAARMARVPAVFTAHGWGFSPGTPPTRRVLALLMEKVAAPLTARIICVSDYDRRLALRFRVGDPLSLVTVRYGIPAAPVSIADPSAQPPRLLMAARFNEQKDQPTLLRALARLPGAMRDQVHVDFAGSGPTLEECRALALALGVIGNVTFLGDRHDVPDLLGRAQGFVLSTHYEGLPISILEAMRAGLPVVATRVSGIPEEVINGETGLLARHRDVDTLALALQALVDSPDQRRRLGEAGRRKFLNEFTLDRMLADTEAVYRQAAAAR